MRILSKEDVTKIIIKEYANADNKALAEKLGIKEQTLRAKASKLMIRKSKTFMKEYYIKLHENKNLNKKKVIKIIK